MEQVNTLSGKLAWHCREILIVLEKTAMYLPRKESDISDAAQ